jgi:hypothetical protein
MICSSFDECTIRLKNGYHNSRLMQNKKEIVFGILVTAVVSVIITIGAINNASAQGKSTVVRDSQAILLEGKTIPSKDFIHLYDTTPYILMNGHLAVKLPCDANSVSPLKILIGQAPNLKAADFELIKELSTPGKMCLYHVDLNSKPGEAGGIITDIAIQNPTDAAITFPSTSTIVIGVNEIMPGAEHGQAMGNMTSAK